MQGTVRTNAKGERLVTLFLVNGQLEPETNRDSAWLFQPEIIVRGAGEARWHSGLSAPAVQRCGRGRRRA